MPPPPPLWSFSRASIPTGTRWRLTCRRQDCPYAHAEVPRSLGSITDLVLEDLGETQQDDIGIYRSVDESKINPAEVLAKVQSDLAAVEVNSSGSDSLAGPFGGPP